MHFPTFTSDRLTLNPIDSRDIDDLFALFSQAEVLRFYDISRFSQRAQAEQLLQFFQQRWQDGSGIRWAIRMQGSQQLIGTCGFNSWNRKSFAAGIGYELSQAYWGQGIASEAVSLMLQAGFNGQLPFGTVHRIQADVVPGNTASEKLLTKLGFKQEGIRRHAGFWDDKFHDLKCFGLIKPEFTPVTKL